MVRTLWSGLSGKENLGWISHIPADRHKHGLILDFDLARQFYFADLFY